MRRALLARFAQYNSLRDRPFALKHKVSVSEVLDNLIEEVSANLQARHRQRAGYVIR
jgi:hypothetical protein